MKADRVVVRAKDKLTRAKAEREVAARTVEELRGRHELANHPNKHVRAKLDFKLKHG